MKIGAVLLAAGRGERFGANKLLADFDGRPMVCCALDVLKQLNMGRTVVVASNMEVEALGRAYGFDVIINDAPQLGQARSVRLGVACMVDMDAILLMVADQPLLTAQSLAALLSAFESGRQGIACLRDQTHSGNPAVFMRVYFEQLLRLEGDRGAKGILRANPEDLTVVDCLHSMELADADDPLALECLRSEYQKRSDNERQEREQAKS